jgi:streptogramin lyase
VLGKLGRNGRAVLAVMAAMARTGVAVAPSLAATPDTVSVLTLPESTSIRALVATQTPSSVDGDWVLLDSGDIDQLNADGSFAHETISGEAINDDESVVTTAGATDYVDDGIHLLALTAPSASGLSSTTLASTSPITQSGIAVGSDANIYVANQDGTILDCSPAGSGCVTRTVPTSFSSGGTINGQPTALTAVNGKVWFTTVAGALGSLAPDGTFSSPYHLGDFSSDGDGLISLGTNFWMVSVDANAIVSVPQSNPAATPTVHTLSTPTGISGATTPDVGSLVVGPDNRIWFTDIANNAVGVLDPTSGAESEYALPGGDSTAGPIAGGPAGTDTLVFPLSSPSDAGNLLGQIQSSSPIVNGPTTTFTSTGGTSSAPSPTSSGSSSTPSPPASGSSGGPVLPVNPTPIAADQPETVITSGPTGDTWTEAPQYTFSSSIPGSSFVCSVDGVAFTPCTSPLTVGIFAPGSTHTLSVAAISPGGVKDPAPATVIVHVNSDQVTTISCIAPVPVTTPGYKSQGGVRKHLPLPTASL